MITEKESSRFFREHRVDFAVAGGGMAGVCCAITAARLGLKTMLIQNRPVLGGPSGSECDCDADGRIVGGASQYGNRNAKETGILEELRLEAAYRYQHGWRNHWSILLREWCEKEQSLKLLLNTEVTGVKTEGNRIVSLSARTLGSELNHIVHAPLFADCTGDAFIGCEAGAEFRMGREARAEFGESLAPEVSDNVVLGSSIFFRAVDVGHPVKFVPPEWACRFEDEDSLCYRVHRDISKGYYWIECGAEHDTIADNEAIYRKLLSILYGVWDHIKNHGDHGAENYAINWISNVAGKRESRRLTGDYMMCEKDIVKHTEYPDAAAYGGWNLDLHPVKGIFSREPPSGPPNAIMCPGVYQIPFRSLYSGKIDNLMMAGRNISASHVALSSTRVMGTCAVCGQAVGAAAFLMTHHQTSAREIARAHAEELRYLLYRMDHTIPGIVNADPLNLTGTALAEADSAMPLRICGATEMQPLTGNCPNTQVVQFFLNSEDFLESAFFLLENTGTEPEKIHAELVRRENSGDISCEIPVAGADSIIPRGIHEVEFRFNAEMEKNTRCAIRLTGTEQVRIALQKRYLPGCHKKIKYSGDNKNYCFRLLPEQFPFQAENVLNPENRPRQRNCIWISEPDAGLPQNLTIRFPHAVCCSSLEIVFDTNLDAVSPYIVPPECVRDYSVEAECNGQRIGIAEVKDNRQRFRVHDFPGKEYHAFHLKIKSTWGDPSARIFQIRVYRSRFIPASTVKEYSATLHGQSGTESQQWWKETKP